MVVGISTSALSIAQKRIIFEENMGWIQSIVFGGIFHRLIQDDSISWKEKKVRAELKNFQRFFALITLANFSVVPTAAIDKVWHTCILDTAFYRDLCIAVHGRFIDHLPLDNSKEAQKNNTQNFLKTAKLFYQMTGKVYSRRFGGYTGRRAATCGRCSACGSS